MHYGKMHDEPEPTGLEDVVIRTHGGKAAGICDTGRSDEGMTIQCLYYGYTITQKREFKERREQFRQQLIREAIAEGLIQATDFDVRNLGEI